MSWRLAKSLIQLRKEIDAAFPGRDKRSDGSIGDAAHRTRRSDHNPNSAGVVTAIDVDEHTDRTERSDAVGGLAEALRLSRDPRIKYVIYEGRMFSSYWSRGIPPWTWRSGSGHWQHVHVSVSTDPRKYDDASPWNLGGSFAYKGTAPVTEEDEMGALSKAKESEGPAVRRMQKALLNWKSDILPQYGADGDFGQETENAVKAYQRAAGLDVTGVADGATLAFIMEWSPDSVGGGGGGKHTHPVVGKVDVSGSTALGKELAKHLDVSGRLATGENA